MTSKVQGILGESDKNSRFYKLSKVTKWRRNAIAEIKLSTGHVLEDPMQIKNYFLQRFQQCFSNDIQARVSE